MPSLILASDSPRRKQLLTEAGYSFTSKTSGASEQIDANVSPAETVETLAFRKASAVFEKHKDSVVLGADTVVALGQKILGKPESKTDARDILTQLSHQSHHVYTGIAMVSKDGKKIFHQRTEVVFYPLKKEWLESYISTEEPYDKAGAYGIQGKGRLFVKSIHGDYFNVVGLPIAKVAQELLHVGILPSFT